MNTNHTLRALRESRNLSIEEVAKEAKISFRTVLRAEQGYPLHPGSRQQLCAFFGKTSEELGLVTQRRRACSDASQEPQRERGSSSQDVLQAATRGMFTAIQNLENEGVDMNRSRRFFLQVLGTAGVALVTAPQELLHPLTPVYTSERGQITDVSASTIEHLASITQQYRSLQRAGLAIEDGLRSHIDLIQHTLENTVSETYRRDLWRIQAQSQLLARHSITKKRELGRARTWNESAIASAQYSGDAFLLAAALGHLGHLYLIWLHDPVSARQLIGQAQEHTKGHAVSGWFAMVAAAIAAMEGDRDECEASIAKATEIVQWIPTTGEQTDLYYTDFNAVGVDAFVGNCFLKVGEPAKTLERLTSINLESLADNRHASACYDIASAHAAMGELDAAQTYAFRSIDKALATDRLYIVPRCITLAQGIQGRDPREPHAAAILEYAHIALQENPKGELE